MQPPPQPHIPDRPLRVLHVITGLKVGGAESMLSRLTMLAPPELLCQKVVSLTPGGNNRLRLQQAGVPVCDLGMVRSWPSLMAVSELARQITLFRPDVIQSWMYHADLFALAGMMRARCRKSVRLVWGVRCSDMDTAHYSRRLKHVIRLCAWLSGRPDAVVANSHVGRDVHLALGYRPRRFEVIPNGVDVERFRPDPAKRSAIRARLGIPADRPLVAQVARVDPMKDYPGLLDALSRLPGIEALVVGEGTQNLPDQPGLHRLGRRDDVADLLPACDLIVSSSAFGEGFSNALAEGMACGLPAVSTEVGDAAVVLGDAGRLVPPRDPAALAAAIGAELGLSADQRVVRAQQARRHIVDNFAIDKIIRDFASFYWELVRGCAG